MRGGAEVSGGSGGGGILGADNPDREAVTAYLDGAVRAWRRKWAEADSDAGKVQAASYVDAFQSVRESLVGEVLP